MKTFLLSILSFLALFATINPVAFAAKAKVNDASLAGVGDYTPAEIRRNEQRKALGMPPIPPRALTKSKKRQKAGRGAQVPFSMATMRLSIGYIAIHEDNVDGLLLGYLSCHKTVQTIDEATEYTYVNAGAVVEIAVANEPETRMCVTTGLYGKSLGLGLKNFHIPRHTNTSTGQGEVPFHNVASASYLETTVFQINGDSNEIEIEWVNPDNSRPPVQIALREERIYYTGDLSSFKEYLNDDSVSSVVFKWVRRS